MSSSQPPPSRARTASALIVSLLLHGALATGLVLYAPRAQAPQRVSTIELEVIERAEHIEPTTGASGPVSAVNSPVKVAEAPPRATVAPGPRVPATPTRDERSPNPFTALHVDDGRSTSTAVPFAPRGPPRADPTGEKLDLRLSAGALQRLGGKEPAHVAVAPPPTEAAEVKQTVDSLFAEAQVLARPAADGAVQGLGRTIERSAGVGTFTPEIQRWVQSGLASYREQALRYGRLGKPIENEWDRIQSQAIRDLDRSGQKYVALVEIRQRSDGQLLDLRLVASSGTAEFDTRALGSVARGLLADAKPLLTPRPEGTLSLWALLGKHQPTGAAAVAGTVYRAVLLDVVDLKPTLVDLEHGGRTEQLQFSARLLAVF